MSQSKVDLIRGMSNLPLNAKGRAEAQRVAKRLGERGGVFGVSSSPLTRAVQTASAVLEHSPLSKLLDVTSCLEPWHLGEYEGTPSADVAPKMIPFVADPMLKVPGNGPISKIPGETLHAFLFRFLPYLRQQVLSNPKGYGLVLCCHFRNIKAALAWAKAGGKQDWAIDEAEFLANVQAPTDSLWCVEFEDGKWVVEPEDLFGEDEPLDDVYLLRHGSTDFNHESQGSSSNVTGS